VPSGLVLDGELVAFSYDGRPSLLSKLGTERQEAHDGVTQPLLEQVCGRLPDRLCTSETALEEALRWGAFPRSGVTGIRFRHFGRDSP
jgi:hypothetical protein